MGIISSKRDLTVNTRIERPAAGDPTGPLATLLATHPLETDSRTFLVFTTRETAIGAGSVGYPVGR